MPIFVRERCALVPLLVSLALWTPQLAAEELDWGVYRLAGLDASAASSDLDAFGVLVGDARYVGLGESIHTSGGFYRMKERLIRYLIEQQGHRWVGIESPWEDVEALDHYVRTCDGDPATILPASVFAVWSGEALLDLVRWMCDWNRRRPNDPVGFFGFDVQQPGQDRSGLNQLFSDLGLLEDPLWTDVQFCYTRFQGFFDPVVVEQCVAAFERTSAFVEANAADLTSRFGKDRLLRARLWLVGWSAHQQQMGLPRPQSSIARDRAMADAFELQRQRLLGSSKAALWAHNVHLIRDGRDIGQWQGMGHHLASRWGDQYRIVGLYASEIHVDWWTNACGGPVLVPPADSLEERLERSGEAYLMVDVSRLASDHPLLPGCTQMRFGTSTRSAVPSDHMDLAVYLQHSEAMEPVPASRSCNPKQAVSELESGWNGLVGAAATPQTVPGCQRPRPPRLETESVGQQTVALTWRSGSLADTFVLLRTGGSGEPFSVELQGSKTSYTDTGLDPGAEYSYRLTGRNRYGLSAPAVVDVTTGLPDLSPCVVDETTYCLHDGRFEVRLEWSTSDETGAAITTDASSSDSGVFWFFSPDNWEALVKVLDGCAINDRFWVIGTATTDVGYELNVRDTWNGAEAAYRNDIGSPAKALLDVGALNGCGVDPPVDVLTAPGAAEALGARGTASEVIESLPEEVNCDPASLCLHDRFRVSVDWRSPQGSQGIGQVVPIRNDTSGLFWFFQEDNWELLAKVIDGCAVNGHYWLIYGATTDVAFDLHLEDDDTGVLRTFRNSGGAAAPSLIDVEAVPCEVDD